MDDFNGVGLTMSEGWLHPVWAYLLMTLCVNAAILVGAYAIFAHGWIRLLGVLVAAALVYRTT